MRRSVCQPCDTDRRRVECRADDAGYGVLCRRAVRFFGDADMSRGFVHGGVTCVFWNTAL
jgi:hypothetical protein